MNKTIETIKRILTEIAQPSIVDGIEYQLVMDTERNHYQINAVGWQGLKRIHGILVQIDIKDSLIWLQEDNTEYRVAEELVKSGIPKDKIALGFRTPYKRL